MNEEHHRVYVRLVDYAGYAAPKQEDRGILEALYEAYSDEEESQTPIYFILRKSHDALATVVDVFEQMIEDPELIDSSMYDLTEWDQFLALTTKLKASLKEAKDTALIAMTFGEWATYSSYFSHVYDLDERSPKEQGFIAEAYAEISEVLIANSGRK